MRAVGILKPKTIDSTHLSGFYEGSKRSLLGIVAAHSTYGFELGAVEIGV